MSEQFIPVTPSHAVYLNDLCHIINDWADKKGWNEGEDNLSKKAEQIALMHSELSECLEFLRKKAPTHCPKCECKLEMDGRVLRCGDCRGCWYPVAMDDHVPSLTGEAAELADVLIRIFHYCGKRNIDLGQAVMLKHQYNTTRPYRHGKNC